MNDKTKLALNVIVASLLLGALGDALLRATPWGINVPLWTGLLVMVILGFAFAHRLALSSKAAWLTIPIFASACGILWRDSLVLNGLSFLALCVSLALASWYARRGRVVVGALSEQLWRLLLAVFNVVIGLVPFGAGGIAWPGPPPEGRWRPARAAGVGVLLAVPLLLLFGSLFMSADAVFNKLVRDAVRIDFSSLLSHLLVTTVCAWGVAGYLHGLLVKEKSAERPLTVAQFCSLGRVEINVALGLLNLLFLVFIVVQLRYLFGGAHLIEVTPGLTYAEYARRGFFELVAVAVLALPLLLAADWLLATAGKKLFRVQATVLVVMLGVVMASAVQRMRLYQEAFGQTELRLYVTAFMGWLAVVFVCFSTTVLRGRREHFAFPSLVAGFLAIVELHVLNPDDVIARTNLQRAQAGRPFDANYVSALSADAFPALLNALPNLKLEDQRLVAGRLRRWQSKQTDDWRTWNRSRALAQAAFVSNQAVIDRLAPDTTPRNENAR
ncbi:MAG: DUF4173 domain-containing protein [Verrucomicrobia bacterium]|nr:DUF4173 domain-containing protein [Verrucomicrobiota bacterium]